MTITNSQFEDIFLDQKRWIDMFISHCITAKELILIAYPFQEKVVNRAGNTSDFEKYGAFSDAAALHVGLAIENLVKAKSISENEIQINENGEAKGLATHHDLLKHVTNAGISLTNEQKEFLKRLAFQTNSLSKYPLAKNLKTQTEFTGICVGMVALKEAKPIILEIISKANFKDDLKSKLAERVKSEF
ncbi:MULTISPECIES: hypothetical protein [Vibrio]|uniref:hypothetical protein n=1 Tax=Vibrio TaxID=662 RepID=UPI0005EF8094|nr:MULTISPECIES: hypothetical protein [Vibrio]EKA7365959.1 hypothetical protein [Vibrio parahaemolyticus]KJQ87980.1 hypothetical protein UG53_05250 [Vibrio sp. S512-13]KJQ92941.1 hypothetical protein UF05_02620 [Vibrio sp. S457-15]MCS0189587.1 hypothetical protein [Vibrio parahaemolyticus]